MHCLGGTGGRFETVASDPSLPIHRFVSIGSCPCGPIHGVLPMHSGPWVGVTPVIDVS